MWVSISAIVTLRVVGCVGLGVMETTEISVGDEVEVNTHTGGRAVVKVRTSIIATAASRVRLCTQKSMCVAPRKTLSVCWVKFRSQANEQQSNRHWRV